jgi:hypothetical protein
MLLNFTMVMMKLSEVAIVLVKQMLLPTTLTIRMSIPLHSLSNYHPRTLWTTSSARKQSY